jgi:hypothetical protein
VAVATPAPAPPVPTCGNRTIDLGTSSVCPKCTPDRQCPCKTVTTKLDQCDGAQLDGATCQTRGFLGGTLRCSKTCTFDTSSCTKLATDHPWKHGLRIGGLTGLPQGVAVPGVIGATRGLVAAAWTVPDPSNRQRYDIAFAWSDPALRTLRTSKPFDGGFAGTMRLGGNDAGWLLAVATSGDNPGPLGPAVRVFPISKQGHVGAPGARVDRQDVLFVERGDGAGPSLVGALHGFMGSNGQAYWRLDGWLVDARGEPATKPFEIGTPTLTYSVMGAVSAHVGGGRLVTARGSTRDPEIELAIVDAKGAVKVLPIAHPDLKGQPIGIVSGKDRITVAFHRSDRVATYVASFTADGKLLQPPKLVAQEAPLALLRPAAAPSLLTMSPTAIRIQPIGGVARAIMAPGFLPRIADAEDASYALAVEPDGTAIVRLR